MHCKLLLHCVCSFSVDCAQYTCNCECTCKCQREDKTNQCKAALVSNIWMAAGTFPKSHTSTWDLGYVLHWSTEKRHCSEKGQITPPTIQTDINMQIEIGFRISDFRAADAIPGKFKACKFGIPILANWLPVWINQILNNHPFLFGTPLISLACQRNGPTFVELPDQLCSSIKSSGWHFWRRVKNSAKR